MPSALAADLSPKAGRPAARAADPQQLPTAELWATVCVLIGGVGKIRDYFGKRTKSLLELAKMLKHQIVFKKQHWPLRDTHSKAAWAP